MRSLSHRRGDYLDALETLRRRPLLADPACERLKIHPQLRRHLDDLRPCCRLATVYDSTASPSDTAARAPRGLTSTGPTSTLRVRSK